MMTSMMMRMVRNNRSTVTYKAPRHTSKKVASKPVKRVTQKQYTRMWQLYNISKTRALTEQEQEEYNTLTR